MTFEYYRHTVYLVMYYVYILHLVSLNTVRFILPSPKNQVSPPSDYMAPVSMHTLLL